MKYYKGMDISTLLEVEKCGAKFYDGKGPEDALDILKRYDVNAVRIRLWNDPYSEDGEPYYTKDTLLDLKEQGLLPNMVQVGNELTNGLLWPYGKVPDYDNIARFVNAGSRAVKEVSETALADGSISERILIMIHLDNGGNNALYREWFDNFVKRGEDFDIIGHSYYPFWHGPYHMLQNNIKAKPQP